MEISQQTLRIIDANLNRLGEGLRFLEDVSRFILNDSALTQRLKNLRHELVRADLVLNQQLLQARDAEGDVGIDLKVAGEEKEKALPMTVVANSRRVQESLRVLEEVAKLPSIPLDSEKFKQARFALYTIEKNLLAKLARREKLANLTGLYLIIDTQLLKGRSHVEVAAQAIRGGARTIQLCDQRLSKRELLPIAEELRKLCAEHRVLFLINHYLDLALAVDADGVHLESDDLPVKIARKLLPMDKILGVSARSAGEAVTAQADGADYIGVGLIFPTGSREKEAVVGLEGLRQTRQAVASPLVAVGGISQDNVSQVLAAGADAVAVVSAILGAPNIEAATRQIVRRIEGKDEKTNR